MKSFVMSIATASALLLMLVFTGCGGGGGGGPKPDTDYGRVTYDATTKVATYIPSASVNPYIVLVKAKFTYAGTPPAGVASTFNDVEFPDPGAATNWQLTLTDESKFPMPEEGLKYVGTYNMQVTVVLNKTGAAEEHAIGDRIPVSLNLFGGGIVGPPLPPW